MDHPKLTLSQRIKNEAGCLSVLAFLLFLLFSMIPEFILAPFGPYFTFVITLLFGFIPFLGRTLTNLPPDHHDVILPTLVVTLLLIAFLAIPLVIIARLLVPRFSLPRVSIPHFSLPRLSLPWSPAFLLLLAVVLLFVSSLAVTGITYQLIGLSREPRMMLPPISRYGSRHNLREIGLALHNYHEQAHRFPPGATFLAAGELGHSWMTALLPFMNQSGLYQSIHHDKTWRDPLNAPSFRTFIPDYHFEDRGPLIPVKDERGYALTRYAANRHVFPADQGTRLQDITDGPSNTIATGEVLHRLKPWADPSNLRDPMLGINKSPDGFESRWPGGAQFLLMDGSARMITDKVDPQILRALALPNDGHPIGKY